MTLRDRFQQHPLGLFVSLERFVALKSQDRDRCAFGQLAVHLDTSADDLP